MIVVNCNLFEKEIEKSGIKHYKLWNKYTALSLRLGKIFRKIKVFSLGNINPCLLNIKDDEIIIFDNGIQENSVLKWFAATFPNKRLIFYYWNPVFKSIHPQKIPQVFEKWSYSPSDCKKYGMKYNSQFYFDSLVNEFTTKIQRDVFFIGVNKGREKKLNEIEKMLNNCNVSSFFYITATHPRLKQKKYKKFIPYESVLEYVKGSKAVLDYYVDPCAGLSLRAMESVFFEKKIITNNKTIIEYDFYCKNNVYLLGETNDCDVNEFLSTPFKRIDNKIKTQYLFRNWIENFKKND